MSRLPQPPHLLIRADASPEIGSGHVMRMMALGQAYQDRGGAVTLASVACPDSLVERLHQEGISFERITAEVPGSRADRDQTLQLAKSLNVKWIVLDGYGFGLELQRTIRDVGFRLLVVDDHGYCDRWSADAVLNQNLFAPERMYVSEAPTCRHLLGTRFALLRREFRAAANQQRPPKQASIQKLLVTLGGGDPNNVTSSVLRVLEAISNRQLQIRVLVGATNPNFEKIRSITRGSRHAIELLRNAQDMPNLYRWADGVISAGGSTCWECLFYRLPTAVICIADNQRPVAASLANHRLALDLGWHENLDPGSARPRLQEWLDPAGREALGLRSVASVDGRGAERVAAVLDETGIWLRPAAAADCRLYFEWANDPEVRSNAIHQEPIQWDAHVRWFAQKLASAKTRLYVAHDTEDRPVGQVRLDRNQEGCWEVDFSVVPHRRSQGLGTHMLGLALTVFESEKREPIIARVRSDNTKSAKVFEKLRFEKVEDGTPGFLRFILRT